MNNNCRLYLRLEKVYNHAKLREKYNRKVKITVRENYNRKERLDMEEKDLVVNGEDTSTTDETNTEGATDNTSTNSNEDLETLKAQFLKLQQDNAKLKKTLDKASSEANEYKKKWKSTQTQAEQEAMEKEEEDKRVREELASLKRENEINKQAKSYLALGYSEEDAIKCSEALLDGNTDELFKIQKKFLEEQALAVKSNKQKSMSNPPSGNGNNEVTKEQFQKMNWKQRQELYNKDKDTYNKLKG